MSERSIIHLNNQAETRLRRRVQIPTWLKGLGALGGVGAVAFLVGRSTNDAGPTQADIEAAISATRQATVAVQAPTEVTAAATAVDQILGLNPTATPDANFSNVALTPQETATSTQSIDTFSTSAPYSGNIRINVPTQVDDTFKLAETPEQTIMLVGTHHIVAEPGGRTTEDCTEADADVSALCSIRSNVQEVFTTNGPEYWLLPEGSDQGPGHVMLTGPTMVVEMPDGRVIDLGRGEEDHNYILIVSGTDGDGSTPGDHNRRLTISDFDGGSTMVTSIPPSQFVSLDYVYQNVDAAMNNECGNDGCNHVTLVTVDNLNAVSVVSFSNGEAQLVASNWYEMEANE